MTGQIEARDVNPGAGARSPAMTSEPQHGRPGHHTLLCRDRADTAAGLREYGIDDETITELLDSAGLHGDAQSPQVRVNMDGGSWFVDLFGPRREDAA